MADAQKKQETEPPVATPFDPRNGLSLNLEAKGQTTTPSEFGGMVAGSLGIV